MGQRFLIDSNAIIDYTANLLPPKGSAFMEQLFNTDFIISVAVKIEVLGFNELPAKLSALEAFLHTATVLPLDESVTRQTIVLRRQYKKLKLGDAIIAATALVYELTLTTRNTKDFKPIAGLKMANPFELK